MACDGLDRVAGCDGALDLDGEVVAGSAAG
jgi:hypothetical protein